jgi:tetratricopeptide (TPR) repeat protein
VRGDLEFRNELIRAQAYYAVAGPARQHLHRRVGELLAARPPQQDKGVSLEIAWHYLRGGEVGKCIPHALAGAESALQGGAPVEAEGVLKALLRSPSLLSADTRIQLLLAKALVDQSKGDAALPVLTTLLEKTSLERQDLAEVLYLRAAAEYLRRPDSSRYGTCAAEALDAALEVGAPHLIARSMFEYARSGVVGGDAVRIKEAVQKIDRALQQPGIQTSSMMFLARSYCRYFCYDAFPALEDAERALRLHQTSANLVERAILLNAHAMCLRAVCRTAQARDEFERALDLSVHIGDDSRASLVSGNLSSLESSRGRFESGLAFARRALKYARADVSQPHQTMVYLILMENYALLGRIDEAQKSMDSARRSVDSAPSMTNRLQFDLEAAGVALIMGNLRLALSLIEDAEQAVQGQELVLQDAGVFERLRSFRAAHIHGVEAAWEIVQAAVERFRGTHPLYYINVLPMKAWLEGKLHGRYSKETEDGLKLLTEFDLEGKRAIWIAQGFLA